MSAPGPHKHHRVVSVCVGGHGPHAVDAVVVQGGPLDDPQAPQGLVQHQATEVVSNLLGLETQGRTEIR